MDKFIYTAFSTVNNLIMNRAIRSNNLANLNVPGFRTDIGAKSWEQPSYQLWKVSKLGLCPFVMIKLSSALIQVL